MKQPVSMAGIKRDEQKGMAVSTQDDNVDALTLGHRFFDELVKPSMEKVCPEVLETGACGIFGNGSECFGMDDVYSRDHHWGPSVSILLPDELLQEMDPDTWKRVAAGLPARVRVTSYSAPSAPVRRRRLNTQPPAAIPARRMSMPNTWSGSVR